MAIQYYEVLKFVILKGKHVLPEKKQQFAFREINGSSVRWRRACCRWTMKMHQVEIYVQGE